MAVLWTTSVVFHPLWLWIDAPETIDAETIKRWLAVVFSIAGSAIVGAIGLWHLVRRALQENIEETKTTVESTREGVEKTVIQSVQNYSKLETLEHKFGKIHEQIAQINADAARERLAVRHEMREDRHETNRAIERLIAAQTDLNTLVRCMQQEAQEAQRDQKQEQKDARQDRSTRSRRD